MKPVFPVMFVLAMTSSAIRPSYDGDVISCDSFKNYPDRSVPLTNELLALQARIEEWKHF